jgi:hypothetical protein
MWLESPPPTERPVQPWMLRNGPVYARAGREATGRDHASNKPEGLVVIEDDGTPSAKKQPFCRSNRWAAEFQGASPAPGCSSIRTPENSCGMSSRYRWSAKFPASKRLSHHPRQRSRHQRAAARPLASRLMVSAPALYLPLSVTTSVHSSVGMCGTTTIDPP